MRFPILSVGLAGALAFCILHSAYAQEERFGIVVLVDEKEIVVDKGVDEGVRKGDTVTLYRVLTVHHPVTGENIVDRFPIGQLKIEESSELLSIIRNRKTLSHSPKVGDLVQLPRPEKIKQPPAPKVVDGGNAQGEKTALVAGDSEAAALNEALRLGLGQPIVHRIARFDRFLEQYPQSTYRDAVAREIDWLRVGYQAKQSAGNNASATAANPPKKDEPTILHSRLVRVEVGDPVDVVIALFPPAADARCHLYLHRDGTAGYEAFEMKRDGTYYYRARVPARYVEKPGLFGYFIELSPRHGEPISLVGSAQSAINVGVATHAVDKRVESNRSRAQMAFEYVNFDADGAVDDEYWSVESDVFYRIYRFLYGVRVGMGFFSGTGGNLHDIEESPDNNKNLAALYGYVEGEFEVVPMFHFTLRGLAGNKRSPKDEHSLASGVFGLEGGVRIGKELETNLVLAGAVFEQIGYEGRIALGINRWRKVPITIEGLVTNFPVVDSNLGMRLVAGVGYRFTPRFALLARGSWNGRTIRHTGFGGGISAAFDW